MALQKYKWGVFFYLSPGNKKWYERNKRAILL
jgi:hypothetical protein